MKSLLKKLAVFFGSRSGKFVATGFAFVFTVFVLGNMIYRERDAIFSQSWQINYGYFGFALIFYSIALFFAVLVWVQIVNSLGAPIPLAIHFRHYCVSMLTKRLPGTVWYIAYRAQVYKEEGLSVQLTSLASGIEYAINIVSGVFVSLVFASPILYQYQQSLPLIFALFGISFVVLHPRFLRWILRRFGGQIDAFNYRKVLLWIFGNIAVRVFGGVLFFFVAKVFTPVSYTHLPYFIGGWSVVGTLAMALLFLPTNLGFSEIGLSLILSSIMPSSIAVIVAIMTRISITVFEILWALGTLIFEAVSKRGINPKVLL